MTNYEFYKDQIWGYILKDKMFAMRCGSDVLTACSHLRCDECVFSRHNGIGGTGCADNRMLWAMQEHIEKPKLTKQEKKFVDVMGADLYLARDEDGVLHLFNQKPVKSMLSEDWMADGYHFNMYFFHNCDFSFIKWEDAKPWDVKMLSELDVENE